MPRIAAAFWLFGILALIAGMALGMHMGANEDFTLAPVHAHINLVGWATMGLYGTFYALTKETKLLWLPRIHFAVSALGSILMLFHLTLFLSHGRDAKYVSGMVSGEALTALGAALFAYSVAREMFRHRHGLDR